LFKHVVWIFHQWHCIWLSHRITITFLFFMYLNSFMNFVIHMVSLVACVLTMYSTLVVDKTIVGYRLLLQKMAPPPIMNINPMVDFLSSRSLTQFASQYPTISWGGNLVNRNLNCKAPYKYRKMCLTTSNVLSLNWPCVQSPRLLGMSSSVKYTTWHTSRIQQLVDKEPLPSQYLCSHSSSTLFWDQMALQWFYNPPCRRALKSPWDTQFGWCKKGIA